MEVLDGWEHQRFLGAECTYGDDRALTNMMLRRGWIAIYDRARRRGRTPRPLPQVLPPAAALEEVVGPRGPDPADAPLAHAAPGLPVRGHPHLAGSSAPSCARTSGSRSQRRHPGLLPARALPDGHGYALMYRALRTDGLWRYAIAATFFYVTFSPQLFWAISGSATATGGPATSPRRATSPEAGR